MLEIDFREITENADTRKLCQFFVERKERIYDLILERLRKEGSTPYIRFVTDHPEGRKRTWRYLDAFEKALSGKVDVFYNDQKRIGYKRAVEGYKLEDVFTHKIIFKKIVLESISNYNAEQKIDQNLININDIIFVAHLLDYSNYLLSFSFLKTRDEIIKRRRNQLRELHLYAAKVVSIFEEQELRRCASQGIYDIFGLHASLFISCVGEDLDNANNGKLIGLQISPKAVEETALKATRSNKAIAIDSYNQMIPLNGDPEQDCFKFICIPLHLRNFCSTDLSFIHDQGRVFKFEKFDKNLLYQFSYFTGAVLSNSRMISELADKKQELRNLTQRLISIQEEERKRIAADIHDTLTQALTAIGYKALLCQELIHKDPSRLNDELNSLVLNINESLKQSRHIMSILRPKILDDLGIVSAIKRMVTNFNEDTDLVIDFTCPKELDVDPEIGIAFFRILQESLHNIKRHACASKVNVLLNINENNQICLMVQDNGQGFNLRRENQAVKNSGLGLLTMRERAEALGGRFEVASRIGDGCRITVTIPS